MANYLLRCLVGGLVAGLATAAPVLEARAPAVALAEHTLPLSRRLGHSSGRLRPFHRALMAVTEAVDAEPAALGSGAVRAEQNQIEYLTEVKTAGQSFNLIVDTGSSDTWIVKEGFQCLNPRSVPCSFAKTFQGDFPGGKITDQHLNITYGYQGGPSMVGDMGFAEFVPRDPVC